MFKEWVIDALKEGFFKWEVKIQYILYNCWCALPCNALTYSPLKSLFLSPTFLMFLFKRRCYIHYSSSSSKTTCKAHDVSWLQISGESLPFNSVFWIYPKNQHVALWNSSDGQCWFWYACVTHLTFETQQYIL